MATNDLLTLSEAAKKLKFSEKTVRKFIAEGKLEASKLGRSWRISPEDIDTFLSNGKTKKNKK